MGIKSRPRVCGGWVVRQPWAGAISGRELALEAETIACSIHLAGLHLFIGDPGHAVTTSADWAREKLWLEPSGPTSAQRSCVIWGRSVGFSGYTRHHGRAWELGLNPSCTLTISDNDFSLSLSFSTCRFKLLKSTLKLKKKKSTL